MQNLSKTCKNPPPSSNELALPRDQMFIYLKRLQKHVASEGKVYQSTHTTVATHGPDSIHKGGGVISIQFQKKCQKKVYTQFESGLDSIKGDVFQSSPNLLWFTTHNCSKWFCVVSCSLYISKTIPSDDNRNWCDIQVATWNILPSSSSSQQWTN